MNLSDTLQILQAKFMIVPLPGVRLIRLAKSILENT